MKPDEDATAAKPIAEPNPAGISSEPRPDFWVPDGQVNAIVEAQGRVYIGGDFNYVGPAADTGGAFDIYSASPEPDFPKVNGAIHAVVVDPNGGWIVGGRFTSDGGHVRSKLAHIRVDKDVEHRRA